MGRELPIIAPKIKNEKYKKSYLVYKSVISAGRTGRGSEALAKRRRARHI